VATASAAVIHAGAYGSPTRAHPKSSWNGCCAWCQGRHNSDMYQAPVLRLHLLSAAREDGQHCAGGT